MLAIVVLDLNVGALSAMLLCRMGPVQQTLINPLVLAGPLDQAYEGYIAYWVWVDDGSQSMVLDSLMDPVVVLDGSGGVQR